MTSETKNAFFADCGESCVSVYANEREGAVIALYGNKSRSGIPQLAVSVGQDGVPRLQLATDAGLVIVDLAKVIRTLTALGELTVLRLPGSSHQITSPAG